MKETITAYAVSLRRGSSKSRL